MKAPARKKTRDERTGSLFGDRSYSATFKTGDGPIAQSLYSRPYVPSAAMQDTGWRPPTTFPSLRDSEIVSLDIESYDPELHAKGPGFLRGDAEIIGVSITARSRSRETFTGYYPIRHRQGGVNFGVEQIKSWLSQELDSDVPKTGANLPYDLEGLAVDLGVRVTGPIFDIQNAEGIIDEESALVETEALRGFSLEKLGIKYCGRGKEETAFDRIQKTLGLKSRGELKRIMRDIPPQAGVGEYAMEDTIRALEVWDKQAPLIKQQKLESIWKLECDLVPLLLAMRLQGVRVDLDEADRVHEELQRTLSAKMDNLRRTAGWAVDPGSPGDLKRLCDQFGIGYMMTDPSPTYPQGQPSFRKAWRKSQTHPAILEVSDIKNIEKMDRDFVVGVIQRQSINGRLHTQFHQLKRSNGEEGAAEDEDGTRSGRFSSTNPNLQQIPKRDKEFAPMIRKMFLPEEGMDYLVGDYNSQEFRLLAHYAGDTARRKMISPKAAEAALALIEKYKENPLLDYHQNVADMTSLERDVAKPLNLMLVYGAGERKVAVSTGWITELEFRDRQFQLPPKVKKFFEDYHEGVPFVKELLKLTENLASERGYVSTILGRRPHFDLWVPRRKEDGWGDAVPLAVAHQIWGNVPLTRGDTRKALNRIIQGSAADMNKRAMLDVYQATGIIPGLTVHDELDLSVIPGDVKQHQLIRDCMVNAVKLLIEVVVDVGIGNNWAEANKAAKPWRD